MQKTTKIALFNTLIALSGAQCWGAAGDLNPETPIGSLALLYESVAGQVSDFADVTPGILESLYRKDLLQLALIGRKEPQRFPNLYQDAMRELFNQKEKFQQLLQQHNGDVQAALFDAAENDKPWAIDYLIQNRADVDAKDNFTYTVLIYAAMSGHAAMIAQLIAARANLNEKNDRGTAALMPAAHNGHEDIAAQLIAARADVNTINMYGDTVLMWAVENGHGAIVAQLIAARADLNARNFGGQTALSWAESTVTNAYNQAEQDGARAIVDLLTRGRSPLKQHGQKKYY